MHPWEDFAECFAHYLHITDTINTVGEAGLVLIADRARVAVPRDIVPLASYCLLYTSSSPGNWSKRPCGEPGHGVPEAVPVRWPTRMARP